MSTGDISLFACRKPAHGPSPADMNSQSYLCTFNEIVHKAWNMYTNLPQRPCILEGLHGMNLSLYEKLSHLAS